MHKIGYLKIFPHNGCNPRGCPGGGGPPPTPAEGEGGRESATLAIPIPENKAVEKPSIPGNPPGNSPL